MLGARRLLAGLALLALSCIPAGRREYQPLSSYEQAEFAKADRRVFPEDVRNRFAALRSREVAWAGIVQRGNVTRLRDRLRITLEIEHHYYDWVETYSPSSAPIWLSSTGEGPIRVVWDVMPDTPDDALETVTKEDNLVVVYGYPKALDGPRVVVRGLFVRGIDRHHYDTHAAEYGRTGQGRQAAP